MTDPKVRVLFVCMGNICRSPTAEGVFRKLVSDAGLAEHIHIESAGTHAYHVGEPPDRRAQAAAERRGVTLAEIRARRVDERDFDTFDLILAMDRDNLADLELRRPPRNGTPIRLFLDDMDVPDPYYGGEEGFAMMMDLIELGAERLIGHAP